MYEKTKDLDFENLKKGGTIFIISKILLIHKIHLLLILKLHKQTIIYQYIKNELYENKHQNRNDFACIWLSLIL